MLRNARNYYILADFNNLTITSGKKIINMDNKSQQKSPE